MKCIGRLPFLLTSMALPNRLILSSSIIKRQGSFTKSSESLSLIMWSLRMKQRGLLTICGLIYRHDAGRITIGKMKLHGSLKDGRDRSGSSMDSLWATLRSGKTDQILRFTRHLRLCTSWAQEKHLISPWLPCLTAAQPWDLATATHNGSQAVCITSTSTLGGGQK